ncbi:hypothetical protein [Ureibacillus sp. FSL K6-0165]|uniref:hypothetical protein n=1 Tax=Ureibacillus sp. FSL K6-0165 TaxID=2954606 RepID=UPI0030FB7FC6
MKTLVIYDSEGSIIQQITGSYRVPVGIPYLEIEVPPGKIVVAVNVETKEPIFEDIPKSDIEILRNKIAEQEQAILELTTTLAILQGGYN